MLASLNLALVSGSFRFQWVLGGFRGRLARWDFSLARRKRRIIEIGSWALADTFLKTKSRKDKESSCCLLQTLRWFQGVSGSFSGFQVSSWGGFAIRTKHLALNSCDSCSLTTQRSRGVSNTNCTDWLAIQALRFFVNIMQIIVVSDNKGAVFPFCPIGKKTPSMHTFDCGQDMCGGTAMSEETRTHRRRK